LQGWRRHISSVAVAASVSFMVVWGWQNFGVVSGHNVVAPDTVAGTNNSASSSAMYAPLTGTHTGVLTRPVQWLNGRQNVMPVSQDMHNLKSDVVRDAHVIRYIQEDSDRINDYFTLHHGYNNSLLSGESLMSYARITNAEKGDH